MRVESTTESAPRHITRFSEPILVWRVKHQETVCRRLTVKVLIAVAVLKGSSIKEL